jgi:hypothetical protein
MDSNILSEFRFGVYRCLDRAADALMDAADALLTESRARSVAELSLSPFFRRNWPSMYEAFQDGKVDRGALQRVFAQYAPLPAAGQRLVVGGDASSIVRPESRTARDRTYVHASNLPEGAKPVRPGWQFSELAVLPEKPSSWVYVLDNRRIPSDATQGEVMAEQLREAVGLLARRLLFLGDGYYGSETFRTLVSDIDCDVLARFARNRVLYREPPQERPESGRSRRGHPRWHGAPFKLHDPCTHGTPDQSAEGTDAQGRRVEVACWFNLHFKKVRHEKVCAIRVIRHGAADTKRDPKVSWFLFWGRDLPAPAQIPTLYALRYSLEHSYRVSKQDLLWEQPRFRTPEQFSVWTDAVSCVRNELFLARDLAEAHRQPWESKRRDNTPEQVRRAMGRIIAGLGTPARLCRPRGYSGGWPPGRPREPAETYRIVYKASEVPRKPADPSRRRHKQATLPD